MVNVAGRGVVATNLEVFDVELVGCVALGATSAATFPAAAVVAVPVLLSSEPPPPPPPQLARRNTTPMEAQRMSLPTTARPGEFRENEASMGQVVV
jgi:hypothetical protein